MNDDVNSRSDPSEKRFALGLAVLLIAVAALCRLAPHPWNCTPVLAIALFAGSTLRARWALPAALAALAVGDLAIGLFPYRGMVWVYGTIVFVTLLGGLLRGRRGPAPKLAAVLSGGLVFYATTNFGVWLGGLYPHTRAGFAACFVAALPFYRNQVIGDLLFSGAIFGLYALARELHARAARSA